MKNFYVFLGRSLALLAVADQAYAQTGVAGPASLLQPQNFAALLMEVESVFAPNPAPSVPGA